jgi:hypothetical protein
MYTKSNVHTSVDKLSKGTITKQMLYVSSRLQNQHFFCLLSSFFLAMLSLVRITLAYENQRKIFIFNGIFVFHIYMSYLV